MVRFVPRWEQEQGRSPVAHTFAAAPHYPVLVGISQRSDLARLLRLAEKETGAGVVRGSSSVKR